MFLGSLGAPEIVLILAMALLLFGPKKLPELGRSLGRGLREFKKGTSGLMESLNDEVNTPVKNREKPEAPPKQLAKATAAKPENEKKQAEEAVVINLEEGNGR